MGAEGARTMRSSANGGKDGRRSRSRSAPPHRSRSPAVREGGSARRSGKRATSSVEDAARGEFILHRIEEVPPHLAFNKFVHTGYRMKLTPSQCAWSVLRLHNETINIWSHTLPILYFIYVFLRDGVWEDATGSYAVAVPAPPALAACIPGGDGTSAHPLPQRHPPTSRAGVGSARMPLHALQQRIPHLHAARRPGDVPVPPPRPPALPPVPAKCGGRPADAARRAGGCSL